MQIVIKIINGDEHNVEVSPDQTIISLKDLLASKLNIPAYQQRLMYKGKSLADNSTLIESSIESGTKLHLVIKKDAPVESNLSKELKQVSKKYVTDVEQFTTIFNQELKRLVNEMSLDDIERYDEARASKQN